MLEQSGPNTGSFRIRSTGYAGKAKVSLVATYKRASFLDYVYFTQLETLDPVTYWTQAMIEGAYTQCTKFYREGRASQNIPGTTQPCIEIIFVSGDEIKGPLHTNDELLICGTPKFGRSAADTIEVGASPQGWRANSSCSGQQPDLRRPVRHHRAGAETAGDQRPAEEHRRPELHLTRVRRGSTLNGTNMKVTTNAGVTNGSLPKQRRRLCPERLLSRQRRRFLARLLVRLLARHGDLPGRLRLRQRPRQRRLHAAN